MKTGDLVRFTSPHNGISEAAVGLLIEYHSWEKIATILYCGKVLRVRAANATKAGKKTKLKRPSNHPRFSTGDLVEVDDCVHDEGMPDNRYGLIVETIGRQKDQHIVMFTNGAFLKFHTIQLKLLVKC